jgi:hypothetical protein
MLCFSEHRVEPLLVGRCRTEKLLVNLDLILRRQTEGQLEFYQRLGLRKQRQELSPNSAQNFLQFLIVVALLWRHHMIRPA